MKNKIKRAVSSGLGKILLAGTALASTLGMGACGTLAVGTPRDLVTNPRTGVAGVIRDVMNPGWEQKQTMQGAYDNMIASERVYNQTRDRAMADGVVEREEMPEVSEALSGYVNSIEGYISSGSIGQEYLTRLKGIIINGRTALRTMTESSGYTPNAIASSRLQGH